MKKILLSLLTLTAVTLVACNNNDQEHKTTTTAKEGDVLDPVCKMVKMDTWTDSSVVHGTTYYFCSINCKERFDKDPHKFLDDHQH